MSKQVKFIETSKLMVYSEVLTKMCADLDNLGRMVYQCHLDEGITEVKKIEIHTVLSKQIDIFEKKRIEIVTEITRRIKEDLGINRGPGQIDELCNLYLKENPMIGKGKAEIQMIKDKEQVMKNKVKELEKTEAGKAIAPVLVPKQKVVELPKPIKGPATMSNKKHSIKSTLVAKKTK